MSNTKTHKTVASLLLGVACLVAPSRSSAVSPVQLSGAISGFVSDNLGIPQMGATVLLFNKQDRALGKLQTDEFGHFRFAGLLPDAYAIPMDRPFTLFRQVDTKADYQTRSMLALPLRDAHGRVFGVLQLINPIEGPGRVGAFSKEHQALVQTLAALAAQIPAPVYPRVIRESRT